MAATVSTCTLALQRRNAALVLVCMASAWCALCMMMSSTSMVLAQGSASATTNSCTFTIWATTLPPSGDAHIVYPAGSVAYQQKNHTIPPVSFFLDHWYVPIALITCAVCWLYIFLAVWVIKRFDFHAQYRAKKVVGPSYATKGYFHLHGDDAISSAPPPSARSYTTSPSFGALFSDHDDDVNEVNPLQHPQP
ncbi:hypothetical protein, conserved [Leishmania tarentolae]|uniref:Uncharacterized protein n=1 Tax=Leishmania tarentolae TaxID=5689 RepID=A0A640KA73_LEITA|nr:hypothetical protein, conserved [Leishmania tarentolae]